MKLNASWWWIDRWRKSTAYTDMTLAEQGAYRNLLDELWLRDGVLPNNERILAKVSGDPFEWAKVRDAVLARFYLTEDGWRNKTHDEVAHQAHRRAENQRRYRERKRRATDNEPGNAPDNEASNVTAHEGGWKPDSPSPSPSPSPKPSQSPSPSLGLSLEHGNGNENGAAPDAMGVELLVSEIATVTGEKTQNFRRLVRAIPQTITYRALAETRTAKLEAQLRTTAGAMFVGLCKRYCEEQHVRWPLRARGTPKDHAA